MTNSGTRWVARLTADSAADIDFLLHLSLGLDVWERHGDSLVVAASEAQLHELSVGDWYASIASRRKPSSKPAPSAGRIRLERGTQYDPYCKGNDG